MLKRDIKGTQFLGLSPFFAIKWVNGTEKDLAESSDWWYSPCPRFNRDSWYKPMGSLKKRRKTKTKSAMLPTSLMSFLSWQSSRSSRSSRSLSLRSWISWWRLLQRTNRRIKALPSRRPQRGTQRRPEGRTEGRTEGRNYPGNQTGNGRWPAGIFILKEIAMSQFSSYLKPEWQSHGSRHPNSAMPIKWWSSDRLLGNQPGCMENSTYDL